MTDYTYIVRKLRGGGEHIKHLHSLNRKTKRTSPLTNSQDAHLAYNKIELNKLTLWQRFRLGDQT